MDPTIIRDRVDQVMKELAIEHLRKRNTLELSGGEAQKVLIASALALKPKILLLDEPLAHLDPYSAANLIHLLNELNKKEKITIIVLEHRLSDIVKYADKLIVLNKTITMRGRPRDIIRELIAKGDQSIEIPVTAELSHRIGLSKIILDINEFIDETKPMLSPHSYDCHDCRNFDEDTSNGDEDKVIVIRDLWYEYPNNKWL
jgi:ABC-type cobalt transport system, ATPase component